MFKLKKIVSVFLLMGCTGDALSVSAADKVAGEQLSANCVGCHGQKGQSSNGQWPNLAAQPVLYLVNQLNAFKSGQRNNPVMQAMASNLTDENITNLAVYYSGLPAVSSGGDQTLAKLGKDKSAMCLGCHGGAGEGNGQFPRLAGQQPDYLLSQLISFKLGARKSGPMQMMVKNISEEDMKSLAAYLGSIK